MRRFNDRFMLLMDFPISDDDVIKWKHFLRYWSFVRGNSPVPVNFPHKGQWRGALMFSLICTRINGWVNNDEAGDLRRNRAHYGVIVMGSAESWNSCLMDKFWSLKFVRSQSEYLLAYSTTKIISVWSRYIMVTILKLTHTRQPGPFTNVH